MRETAEETGLDHLSLQGPIRVIDWHFRFRGRHIHKYCHFFLFESPDGEPCPQVDEGITACQWRPLDEALELAELRQRPGRAQAGRRDGPHPGGGRRRPFASRGRAPGEGLTVAGIAAALDSRERSSRFAAHFPGGPGVVTCRSPAALRRLLDAGSWMPVVLATPSPAWLRELATLQGQLPGHPPRRLWTLQPGRWTDAAGLPNSRRAVGGSRRGGRRGHRRHGCAELGDRGAAPRAGRRTANAPPDRAASAASLGSCCSPTWRSRSARSGWPAPRGEPRTPVPPVRRGRAPNLKRVIDLTRIACAAQMLQNPGYGIPTVVRLLHFASSSHLSSTARRIANVPTTGAQRARASGSSLRLRPREHAEPAYSLPESAMRQILLVLAITGLLTRLLVAQDDSIVMNKPVDRRSSVESRSPSVARRECSRASSARSPCCIPSGTRRLVGVSGDRAERYDLRDGALGRGNESPASPMDATDGVGE